MCSKITQRTLTIEFLMQLNELFGETLGPQHE